MIFVIPASGAGKVTFCLRNVGLLGISYLLVGLTVLLVEGVD